MFMVVGRSAWRPHILYNNLRQFSRVCGETSGLSSAWSKERVNVFDQHGFATASENRGYLIYHIDEGLRVVPKEAADCVALVLTREDDLDHGRKFMQSKYTSGRAPVT